MFNVLYFGCFSTTAKRFFLLLSQADSTNQSANVPPDINSNRPLKNILLELRWPQTVKMRSVRTPIASCVICGSYGLLKQTCTHSIIIQVNGVGGGGGLIV